MRSRSPNSAVALLATAVVVLLAVGCGAPSADRRAGSDAAPAAEVVDQDLGAAQGGDRGARSDRPPLRTRSGNISLAVPSADDVGDVADEVVTLVADEGGLVDDDVRRFGDRPSAHLVVRVPPDRLDEVVVALGDLADVVEQSLTTEDVSTAHRDMEAALATSEASVERMRDLMGAAEDVGDVLGIERELVERETELATLRRQLAALDDRIDLATLDVAILSDAAVADRIAASEVPTPAAALRGGWEAFLLTLSWLLAVVLAVLPFAVATAVLVGLGRFAVRRRRARRPAPPTPPVEPASQRGPPPPGPMAPPPPPAAGVGAPPRGPDDPPAPQP